MPAPGLHGPTILFGRVEHGPPIPLEGISAKTTAPRRVLRLIVLRLIVLALTLAGFVAMHGLASRSLITLGLGRGRPLAIGFAVMGPAGVMTCLTLQWVEG